MLLQQKSQSFSDLVQLVEKMNNKDKKATRLNAGDDLWSSLVFVNIQKTRTRVLKGGKVANRVRITGQDIKPIVSKTPVDVPLYYLNQTHYLP